MAKGQEAKNLVIQKIREAFGQDFVGEFDKKVYVWSNENGERIQVALALTCPKIPVGVVNQTKLDFTDSAPIPEAAPVAFEPAEFTDQERKTVEQLMKELGL